MKPNDLKDPAVIISASEWRKPPSGTTANHIGNPNPAFCGYCAEHFGSANHVRKNPVNTFGSSHLSGTGRLNRFVQRPCR
jgi:hypothetical protein